MIVSKTSQAVLFDSPENNSCFIQSNHILPCLRFAYEEEYLKINHKLCIEIEGMVILAEPGDETLHGGLMKCFSCSM